MRVLITGAGGQLGRQLVRTAPSIATVKATNRSDLDLSDGKAIGGLLEEFRPTLVLNAATYTQVDKAESERSAAWRSNADGPALLGAAVRLHDDCRLKHISSDYVFDGNASLPYGPKAATAPLSVYGQTKLEGERAVLQALGLRSLVLRTSWVYGPHGRKFLHTMLSLMREHGSVREVDDQIGSPTATPSLAEVIWAIASCPALAGIYHWADAGLASWYDFVVAIAEEATMRALLPSGIDLRAIATEVYPTPAKRPRFSLLDKRQTVSAIAIVPQHWRSRRRQVLDEIGHD